MRRLCPQSLATVALALLLIPTAPALADSPAKSVATSAAKSVTKADLCAAATAEAKAMAAKLPIEVDAVTETTGVTAACDAREMRLARTVALKQSRMEADFKDYLQDQDNTFACTDPARRALVDGGWQWVTTYTFQDGAPVVIRATCK